MKKKKRILAWIGIVLLVGLYVATFIFAMIDSSAAYNMFKVCLGFTIIIPVLLYAYNMVRKAITPDDKTNTPTDKEHKK